MNRYYVDLSWQVKILRTIFISLLLVGLLSVKDAAALGSEMQSPSWKELKYVATILFFSAAADIKYTPAGADLYAPHSIDVNRDLTLDLANSKPLTGKKGKVEQLVLYSDFMGKQSNISLFFESNLNALQRTQLDSGRKHRFKLYQFLEKGVYSLRLNPKSGQEHFPPSKWADKGEQHFQYPSNLDLKQPVLDATSLFYVMSAGLFNKPGDQASFIVFAKGQLLVLQFLAKEWTVLETDYFEQSGGEKVNIESEQKVLRIILKATPLVPGKKSTEFEFIGLKGDLNFYIDTRKRLLLQLSGAVKIVGTVDIVLRNVTLN
ncbi:MAG: hypothetical protein ACC707_10820 [Thiohalomonadales bacterium]